MSAALTTAPVHDGRPHKLPSLTGLRMIAALLVFLFHVSAVGLFSSVLANKIMAHSLSEGVIGVTFFFILSGFILVWTARPNDTAPKFWRRRFVKIAPNHVVTWIVAFVFLSLTGLTLTGGFNRFGLDSIPNLFMVSDWIPRASVYFSMNIPSWSLGCEAFFYLMFPLLFRAIRKIDTKYLWPAAIVLVGLAWLMPLIATAAFHGGNPVPGLPVTEVRMWFVYTLPPVRAIEFVLGMILARIVQTGRWINVGLWPASILALGAYVGSSYLPYLYGLIAGAIIPLGLLVPAAATADLTGKRSPWRRPVMVWLGNVSFAFYLVHQLTIRWVHDAFGATKSFGTPAAIGIAALSLVVSLGLATLLYYCVETPLVRRFSSARRTRPAAPIPAEIPAPPSGDAMVGAVPQTEAT